MVGSVHRGRKLVPVLFCVSLVAWAVSSCSNSSNSGSGTSGTTPTATIFVQNFKYNGVPANVSRRHHRLPVPEP